MAQLEHERQSNNAWFNRASLSTTNLVGVDVVARRISPPPLVVLPPRYHQFMELSMVRSIFFGFKLYHYYIIIVLSKFFL